MNQGIFLEHLFFNNEVDLMSDKVKNIPASSTKEQEFEYKIGKVIIITALIVEIINLIPGTIFGNLWLCLWAYNDSFFFTVSRILPLLGLFFSICTFKGYRYVKYALAIIYGINIFRIALNIPIMLSDLSAMFNTGTVNGLIIFFIITTITCLVYNLIMCISMSISKNVTTYSYYKLYK